MNGSFFISGNNASGIKIGGNVRLFIFHTLLLTVRALLILTKTADDCGSQSVNLGVTYPHTQKENMPFIRLIRLLIHIMHGCQVKIGG